LTYSTTDHYHVADSAETHLLNPAISVPALVS